MPHHNDMESNNTFDLLLGLILGLLGGTLIGLLFAPKPGKELQEDLQSFIDTLPDQMNDRLSRSKVQYRELVGKTRDGLESQLEQISYKKRAGRMADAKRREEQEAGGFEY